MKVTEIFHNIECDCCKALVDEMHWSDPETIKMTYDEEGWKNLGGKDYCPDCYESDDNDNIITKDCKKFDGETYEEIV